MVAERTVGGKRVHGRRVQCGVPMADCRGSLTTTSQGGTKLHSTNEDAFACYGEYLVKHGYKKVGSREFEAPGGEGPIVVLTKKSRFGTSYRPGKEGRWMYHQFTGGAVSK